MRLVVLVVSLLLIGATANRMLVTSRLRLVAEISYEFLRQHVAQLDW